MYHHLARKYRNVGSKVDAIWNDFTPKQRETAMRGSVGDGKVLQHRRGPSLGMLREYIPEYNLREMTSQPEHFLNIFKFRALTELYHQLFEGTNGDPGDRELMENPDMRFAYAIKGELTCFNDAGKNYGLSFICTEFVGDLFPGIPLESLSSIFIPRVLGELILHRHQFFFLFLNHIVEEILMPGSETRNRTHPKNTENEALITAVSALSVQLKPLKSSLPEVCAQAMEFKAALEDYLLLLRAEPSVLDQAVNALHWSRAELVPDDRGRVPPVSKDHHLSAAFVDAVTTAAKTIAIWDYILRLLQLLNSVADKVKRGLILQELSNICHWEYRRTQENFKRKVAPHMANKHFKRITDEASSQAKIVMKGQPSDCTISDPQLHYVLRLCHSETCPSAAVQWIQKLDDHNARYPEDRGKLAEAEAVALGDLAIIVSFMHVTSTAISMTPLSRKSGLVFTARARELDAELNQLKPKSDFGDYLIPIGNILEPQMASRALVALDEFIMQETGAKLGSLCEDIVQDSLEDLEKMCAEAKARLEKADKKTTYVPLPAELSTSGDARLAHRRAKEKTCPTGSSVYVIKSPAETSQVSVNEAAQQFKVKAATASLLAAIFSKAEARGSVQWANFESAMAYIGFSVTPNGGSIYTFNPPASMGSRPITLHRPHISRATSSLLWHAGCRGRTGGLLNRLLLLDACGIRSFRAHATGVGGAVESLLRSGVSFSEHTETYSQVLRYDSKILLYQPHYGNGASVVFEYLTRGSKGLAICETLLSRCEHETGPGKRRTDLPIHSSHLLQPVSKVSR
jgi:hypothetical protein